MSPPCTDEGRPNGVLWMVSRMVRCLVRRCWENGRRRGKWDVGGRFPSPWGKLLRDRQAMHLYPASVFNDGQDVRFRAGVFWPHMTTLWLSELAVGSSGKPAWTDRRQGPCGSPRGRGPQGGILRVAATLRRRQCFPGGTQEDSTCSGGKLPRPLFPQVSSVSSLCPDGQVRLFQGLAPVRVHVH